MRPWITAAIVSLLLAVVASLAFRQVEPPMPAVTLTPASAEAPSNGTTDGGVPPAVGDRATLGATPPPGATPAAERLMLFYTGEQRGYLEPCGCAKPMIGGIARRAKYLGHLPAGITGIKVDNGDLIEVPDRQHELKAEALAQFYQKAAYDAVNLGEKDFMLGFGYLRYLQRLANLPFLSANTVRSDGKPAFGTYTLRSVTKNGQAISIAIIGTLAAAHGEMVTQWNPDLKVEDPGPVLDRLRHEIEGKAKLVVLLFHGTPEEARPLLKERPWIHVCVTAHEAEDYRARPEYEGAAVMLNAGQKGKYLGQLEIKTDAEGDLSIEPLLAMPMEETIGDDPEVRGILKQYLRHVAAEDLLSKVPKQKSPNGQGFAGTAACVSCHATAHKVWKGSAHARAFQTLVNEGHERDPDCVGCHVVGLEFAGGFRSIEQTAHLKDVGCESCHLPQAEHAKNPLKVKPKKVGAASCAPCHVPDHSPRFDFKTYWSKIKH